MIYLPRTLPFPRTRKSRKRLLAVSSILLFIYLITYIYNRTDISLFINQPEYVFINKNIESRCVIPKIDPFDPGIMTYYNWHPPPLKCDKSPSLVFVDIEGVLQFNESVYNKYKGKQIQVDCTYSIVKLIDDFHIEFEKEVKFIPPITINADVFIVRCKDGNSKIIYENLHHKVDKTRTLERRTDIKDETEEDLSVLIFGVDSLSRLAAFRKLQKTVAYLKEDLGAYIFNGYNKVGDNTFPNLVALFAGISMNNLKFNLHKEYCEILPLVWKNFSDKGYVKFFAEDWPEIATFDQSMPMGFKTPPAEHYMRQFFLAMRKVQPMQHDIDMILQFLESQAIKLTRTSTLCYGNKANHMLVIDYYKQFLHAYQGKLKFAFGWLNELGHNFVNFFELGDDDFLSFLKWMKSGKHLENSILIFVSDHGSRVDGIRNTYIGRIEDRMPFLAMVLPERFKSKYPHIHKNLKANTNRLTSTFDVHATLKDIVNKRFSESDVQHSSPISLFQKIPSSRSCRQASIPAHYCVCYSSQPLNTSSSIANELASFVVNSINMNLKSVHDKCAVLKLHSVENAEILLDNMERQTDREPDKIWNRLFEPEKNEDMNYRVTIKTVPGNGLFEATLKYYATSKTYKISDDISRINKFGNQTKCMTNRELRDYCYCI